MDSSIPPPDRRTVLRLLLAGPGGAVAGSAVAQGAYSTRPVTLLVHFPPGGGTDTAARLVAPGMSAVLGQPVVVENRGGGAGNIGTEAVIRARPDGYTLLAGNVSPIVINPHTMPGMGIDPVGQLVPVALISQGPLMLCIHPAIPARTLTEFAAWARGQARGVDYGSSGAGGITHIAMELLRGRLGIEMTHVPYRGSGPAMQDFLTGRIAAMMDGMSVLVPFIGDGRLRPLLVTGAQRSAAAPEVPTAAEAGLPDFAFYAWTGLFAPLGTPAEVVSRVNAAVAEALRDPAVRARITSGGGEPGGGPAEAFARQVRADFERWGAVVRANNIRAE